MWKQKSHRWIYSFLFVFSVAFISLFGLSSDSYAVSDLVFTSNFDGSIFPSIGNFCNDVDSSLPNCSDYSYLIIDSSIPVAQNLFSANGTSRATSMAYSTFSIIKIPSEFVRIGFFGLSSSSGSLSDYIKFTLTDNYSSCPICPEIPENPYDDKLDSIRNAIILVPAVCLLLYFFYVIFGIIIPTTGGKK